MNLKKILLFLGSFWIFSLGLAQTYTDIAAVMNVLAASNSVDGWGNGVNFFDFNNDGWDDISFALEGDTQAFYLNNQGLYEKVNFGIYNSGRVKQLLWLDYDNDGDNDLLLSVFDRDVKLYQNDGNFNFTDVSAFAGLYLLAASNYGISAADYNKDGYLDLFVARYNIDNIPSPYNLLYQNNGNGTFTDVSISSGIYADTSLSFMGVWLDYNKDSWIDLYVINDRSSGNNLLYRNNGDGTFTDIAQLANVGMNGEDPMTATIADFDNDNDLDIYCTNTSIYFAYRPKLFVNQGNNSFINQANFFGVEVIETSWGSVWLDYDNDGFQDLYVATDYLNPATPPARNYLLKNNFPSAFSDQQALFNSSDISISHAVARGDFDNNGFYDIVVHNEKPNKPFLWLNSGSTSTFIKVSLEGTISNSMAIGSWIRVFAMGNQYNQYLHCGENYLGQNSQHHIFGLGNLNLVDSVIVTYPSGIIDKYYNLDVNQHYFFIEGETNYSSITWNGDTVLCEGDSLLLSAEPAVSYLWNTGDTTSTIWVESTGLYRVIIEDSLGLQKLSNEVSINVLPQILIDISHEDVTCFQSNDGYIELDIENNNLDYLVYWSNGGIGNSIDSLAAGWYSFIYTNEFACSFEDSILIEQAFEINVQYEVSSQSDTSLGSLAFIINGGEAPYLITLNNDTINSSFINLEAGIYNLEIWDANDCYWLQSIDIPYFEDTLINSINESNASFRIAQGKDQIFVDFYETEINEYDIYVFDLLGKVLFFENVTSEMSNNHFEISTKNFSNAGLLFLKMVKNNTSSYSFQLLIN